MCRCIMWNLWGRKSATGLFLEVHNILRSCRFLWKPNLEELAQDHTTNLWQMSSLQPKSWSKKASFHSSIRSFSPPIHPSFLPPSLQGSLHSFQHSTNTNECQVPHSSLLWFLMLMNRTYYFLHPFLPSQTKPELHPLSRILQPHFQMKESAKFSHNSLPFKASSCGRRRQSHRWVTNKEQVKTLHRFSPWAEQHNIL